MTFCTSFLREIWPLRFLLLLSLFSLGVVKPRSSGDLTMSSTHQYSFINYPTAPTSSLSSLFLHHSEALRQDDIHNIDPLLLLSSLPPPRCSVIPRGFGLPECCATQPSRQAPQAREGAPDEGFPDGNSLTIRTVDQPLTQLLRLVTPRTPSLIHTAAGGMIEPFPRVVCLPNRIPQCLTC